jgi:hypothetical protein
MESSILSDFSQIIFFVNPEAAGRISLEPKKVEIPRIAAVMGRPDLSRAGAVFKTVFFAKTSHVDSQQCDHASKRTVRFRVGDFSAGISGERSFRGIGDTRPAEL